MAITLIRTLLFVAGGLAAASTTAYVSGALDPYVKRTPARVASLPDAPPAEVDAKIARLPSEEPSAAPTTPATPMADQPLADTLPGDASAPVATTPAGIVAPSFDVVRVEGDGSIVIAGKAATGAKVEIVIGSHVIGQAVAGPDGDFAVVLEDPLAPGGYQIVLRSTTPDNVVAMSVETAVVSVPETENGQVLALVEEPGKPSEMISVPQPEATPELPAAGNQASAPYSEQPAADAPVTREEAASGTAGEQLAATKPGGQSQAALQPETALAIEPGPSAPAQPMVVVEAVEIEGRTIFVAGSADPGRRVRGYANDILLGDAEATPNGRFLIEAERDLPVGDYIIRVDALEPDGVKVAARAAVPFEREPGESIAAIAPPAQAPVAETPAAESAPALEAPVVAETPPASGAQVPETAQAPAVADAPATETPPAVADAPMAASPPAVANSSPTEAPPAETDTADAPVIEPVQPGAAQTVAEAPPAELAEPGLAEAVAEDPAAEPSQPGTAAEAQVPPEAPAVAKNPAVESPATTAPASPPAIAEAREAPTAPTSPAGAGTAEPEIDIAEAPADSATPASPPAVAGAPDATTTLLSPPAVIPTPTAQPEVDMAEAPADGATASPPSDGVPMTTAPKLQSVNGAVIIRRGDTLWRISRRVYGRGIRYSTIYLANQKQIEDPDRIWPGQVFTVPKKTSEGVAADMTRIGDQVTTVPQ